jgi:hypothetical protein
MIIDFLRALLLVLLLFVIIVDFDLPIIINTATNQLFIAIIVIFIILTVDEIVGFLTGLIFLIIYFKYYQKKINSNTDKSNNNKNENFTTTTEDNSPLTNFFNVLFNQSDVKPKEYSNKPEIPDHFVNKTDNCTVIPYVSKELLKSAQNNIYNENNYNNDIKQVENSYGIQGLNSNNIHYLAFDNNYTNFSSV